MDIDSIEWYVQEKYDDTFVIQNPPQLPLSQEEMDAVLKDLEGESFKVLSVKKGEVIKTSPFLDLFIHGAGVILAHIVGNNQHFHSDGSGTHGDLQLVTYFYIVAGLYHTAVDADAAVVAGFVGHGAALN